MRGGLFSKAVRNQPYLETSKSKKLNKLTIRYTDLYVNDVIGSQFILNMAYNIRKMHLIFFLMSSLIPASQT